MGQTLSNLWRHLLPKVGDKPLIAVQDDQPNQLTIPLQHDDHLQSHCINISDLHPISGSIDENVCTNLVPEAPCILVDLSRVDQKDAKADQEAEAAFDDDDNNDEEEVVEIVVDEKTHIEQDQVTTNNVTSTDVISVSRRTVRRLGLYNSSQKLLLVGEGDFSFSASLAVAFGSASNMIATSLNSQDFLIKNYSMFPTNKSELETRGSMVIHGVDATKLLNHSVLGCLVFDRIVFNFPHVGKFGKTEAEMRTHQKLIRGFLKNAKKMINGDGEIHITHKSNGFFLKWDIPKIGSDHGLRLIREVKFKRSKYPGYHPKYGFGGDKDFDCSPSKTYKFGWPAS